ALPLHDALPSYLGVLRRDAADGVRSELILIAAAVNLRKARCPSAARFLLPLPARRAAQTAQCPMRRPGVERAVRQSSLCAEELFVCRAYMKNGSTLKGPQQLRLRSSLEKEREHMSPAPYLTVVMASAALAAQASAQLTLALDVNGFEYAFADSAGSAGFGGADHTGVMRWSSTAANSRVVDAR